jgi:hypothetical protein
LSDKPFFIQNLNFNKKVQKPINKLKEPLGFQFFLQIFKINFELKIDWFKVKPMRAVFSLILISDSLIEVSIQQLSGGEKLDGPI